MQQIDLVSKTIWQIDMTSRFGSEIIWQVDMTCSYNPLLGLSKEKLAKF